MTCDRWIALHRHAFHTSTRHNCTHVSLQGNQVKLEFVSGPLTIYAGRMKFLPGSARVRVNAAPILVVATPLLLLALAPPGKKEKKKTNKQEKKKKILVPCFCHLPGLNPFLSLMEFLGGQFHNGGAY